MNCASKPLVLLIPFLVVASIGGLVAAEGPAKVLEWRFSDESVALLVVTRP